VSREKEKRKGKRRMLYPNELIKVNGMNSARIIKPQDDLQKSHA